MLDYQKDYNCVGRMYLSYNCVLYSWWIGRERLELYWIVEKYICMLG